jgi:nitroreductase
MNSLDTINQILDLARWAPSGDNTQPWRFEILAADHALVHGFDTRAHCVYDLDGHPSQIAMGSLLETVSIAASAHGLRMDASRRPDADETRPLFDLRFSVDPSLAPDPLRACIERRSVQRRPLRTRALSSDERLALERSVGDGFSISWLASTSERLRTAKMLFHSAKLRLVMPEAYRVHKDIIEWDAQFSIDRVPDQALGTDPLTTRLMRVVMHSWERVSLFNRYFAGTWAPRIQLDFIPGIACAAHFLLLAQRPPQTIDDYIAAGRAVQRFWLTATLMNLQLQPEVTPLVFTRYARQKIAFSKTPGMAAMADQLAARFGALVGQRNSELAVFMGRVGAGKPATARSLRRPLDTLMVAEPKPKN